MSTPNGLTAGGVLSGSRVWRAIAESGFGSFKSGASAHGKQHGFLHLILCYVMCLSSLFVLVVSVPPEHALVASNYTASSMSGETSGIV